MPVYEPDHKMTDFLDSLLNAGFKDIIVVNDGSPEETLKYFEDASSHSEVTLLTHDVNRGKGKALKTALSYLAQNREDVDCAVTVDGDGQHDVKSINACLAAAEETPDAVILGGRDFKGENVPRRSRWGNAISRTVYRFTLGIKINDTQTGLRVIPAKYFDKFSKLSGDRYEYETNMLIAIVNSKIEYHEIPISTIYVDDNQSTHFNTFSDAAKIYRLVLKYFLRFAVSSFSSWLIDMGVYALLMAILSGSMSSGTRIFICTAGSRVVSSVINYMLNKHGVFRSREAAKNTVFKYYALAVVQMCLSYALVYLVTDILGWDSGIREIFAKAVVDLCLFLFSYQIQRRWIFVNRKDSVEKK